LNSCVRERVWVVVVVAVSALISLQQLLWRACTAKTQCTPCHAKHLAPSPARKSRSHRMGVLEAHQATLSAPPAASCSSACSWLRSITGQKPCPPRQHTVVVRAWVLMSRLWCAVSAPLGPHTCVRPKTAPQPLAAFQTRGHCTPQHTRPCGHGSPTVGPFCQPTSAAQAPAVDAQEVENSWQLYWMRKLPRQSKLETRSLRDSAP
jgi:hypothetical protein